MILIPTKGRVSVAQQHTWKFFQGTDVMRRGKIILVCPPEEVEGHKAQGRNAIGLAHRYLSESLEKCIHVLSKQMNERRIILMDDDLRFSRRIQRGDWKLRKCEPADMDDLFAILMSKIGEYPMVGVSSRQNNNRQGDDGSEACRQSQVHGIDCDYFEKHDIHPDEVILKSDFFMTLRVLTSGRPNFVITEFAVDQALGSNAPGGVSQYRDTESMNEAARVLQNMFPGFVSLRQKRNVWRGSAMDSPTFLDVTIQWKQALKCAGGPLPLEKTKPIPATEPEPKYDLTNRRNAL